MAQKYLGRQRVVAVTPVKGEDSLRVRVEDPVTFQRRWILVRGEDYRREVRLVASPR